MVAKKAMLSNNFVPSSYMEADPYGGYPGSGSYDLMGYDELIRNVGSMGSSENKILEYQNFLRTPPLALFNLVPQGENGEVTFTANLKAYTQLYILAID